MISGQRLTGAGEGILSGFGQVQYAKNISDTWRQIKVCCMPVPAGNGVKLM